MPMAFRKLLIEVKDGKQKILAERLGRVVTEKNITSIANWVGHNKNDKTTAVAVVHVTKGKPDSDHRVEVITGKTKRVARVGDIVVKRGKDDYIVIKKKELEKFIPLPNVQPIG